MNNENKVVNKPVIRKGLQSNFISYLYETYELPKNDSNTYYDHTLEYQTEEKKYFQSQKIKSLVKEYGLAILGFRNIIRDFMTSSKGFGVPNNTEELDIMFFTISKYYDIEEHVSREYLDALLNEDIFIVIKDDIWGSYISCFQQIYNFEYKYWTRLNDRKRKTKSRRKTKSTLKNKMELPNVTSDLDTSGELPRAVFEEFGFPSS